jgi:hypothetical protein
VIDHEHLRIRLAGFELQAELLRKRSEQPADRLAMARRRDA